MRAASALLPADRDPFLRALAHRLRREVIGDGSVGRAIAELMRPGGFFRPPQLPAAAPRVGSGSKLASGPAILASGKA
jgi:hypothetical protein